MLVLLHKPMCALVDLTLWAALPRSKRICQAKCAHLLLYLMLLLTVPAKALVDGQ